MKTEKHDAIILSSTDEKEALKQLVELCKKAPIPDDELLANLGLFLTSKNLSRLLFFYEMYRKIVHSHGVIMEFGIRWGQTLAAMTALRGIFEPFNRHRKIIGFDTFTGLKGVDKADGTACKSEDGSFSVPKGYEDYLEKLLALQEAVNPISHLRKFEIVKGDAAETVPEYLKKHPETIISLAVFDFDIYRPTKVTLEAIMPHISKNTILVFDELCDDIFPGETVALREVLQLRDLKIQRLPMTSRISYIEIS
ncbi:MAG: crotonobetainyl-CoA--carnitine CoA-transferase [Planctomycetota bacterium]